MRQFIATVLFCVLFIFGMQKSAWNSNQEFHSILETSSTLITLFVALLAMIRYFARRDLKVLMLAAAFAGTTILNAFHVMSTSSQFNNFFNAHWETLIPWSWMAERLFLGLYLLAAGDTLWSLKNPKISNMHMEGRAVTASITLGVASLAYFIILPQPTVYIEGGFIGRPQEVFAALFFLLAFFAYYRLNDWPHDSIDLWLMHSLLLAFMAEICMSLAHENFDAYFDSAHVLKILASAILLYGLSRGIYLLYGEEARTKRRLNERETLLAEAQEIAHVGNWEWDVIRGDIHWSDELYRIFGVAPEYFTVTFENYLGVIHEGDRDRVKGLVQQCFDTGAAYEMVHRVVHQDGVVRWLQCRGKAIRDDEGNIIRLVGTAQDVTESYLNEERFRNLLEAAPDGMVISDQVGKIILVNAQTEKLFGYTREELLGNPVEALIPEQFREHHATNRQEYFTNPVTRSMGAGLELYGLRKDGREFPVEISLSPLNTPKGKMAIAAVRDVTDTRAAQQALARYASELERSNTELERFAYVASHDMKEPLRKIQAFGDRLAGRFSNELGETGKDYIDRMQDAARRMSQLIEDMLTYSRIEIRSGAWETVSLQSILDSTLQNLDVAIQDNNAEILADTLPEVEGHPWQLEMLFQNLLSNAVKYRSPDRSPRIHIRVIEGLPQKGWLTISIEDNGIGFHKDYGEQIFQPFERLHSHKEYPGTGIGLSICRKIVEHHNGRITATGEPEVGAEFVIELPVKQDAESKS